MNSSSSDRVPAVRNVCVFCSAQTENPRHLSLAAELGSELARRGHVLVSGGGRVSSMGALARAARAGGAHTIGVNASTPWVDGVDRVDREVDELFLVPDLLTRKQRMEKLADGFVVIAGGIGTLNEMLDVWAGRALGLHHKPLVILDPDGLYAPLRAQLQALRDHGLIPAAVLDQAQWVETVTEALDHLETSADESLTSGR